MARRPIRTDAAPPPGGAYSQGIAAGSTVYLAGQGPFEPGSGEKVEGTFAEQARRAFENLAAVAEAAGGSLADAVRVGVYLRDMTDFAIMNDLYPEFFHDPLPARTTIQSNLPGFSIEVDAILHIDG